MRQTLINNIINQLELLGFKTIIKPYNRNFNRYVHMINYLLLVECTLDSMYQLIIFKHQQTNRTCEITCQCFTNLPYKTILYKMFHDISKPIGDANINHLM